MTSATLRHTERFVAAVAARKFRAIQFAILNLTTIQTTATQIVFHLITLMMTTTTAATVAKTNFNLKSPASSCQSEDQRGEKFFLALHLLQVANSSCSGERKNMTISP